MFKWLKNKLFGKKEIKKSNSIPGFDEEGYYKMLEKTGAKAKALQNLNNRFVLVSKELTIAQANLQKSNTPENRKKVEKLKEELLLLNKESEKVESGKGAPVHLKVSK